MEKTCWRNKWIWGSSIICDTTSKELKDKYTIDFKAESCYSDGTTCTSYDINTFLPEDCYGASMGSLQNYMDTTLNISNISEDEIKFIATSTYCDSNFCQNGKTIYNTIKKILSLKELMIIG